MAKAAKAPAQEPAGYQSTPGFVKSKAENNEHYVAQLKGSDWYPIISWLHQELNELIPGYNIAQIKSKFGELRFYFDYPERIEIKPDWKWRDTEEKVRAVVAARLSYATDWVSGFEAAKKAFGEQK